MNIGLKDASRVHLFSSWLAWSAKFTLLRDDSESNAAAAASRFRIAFFPLWTSSKVQLGVESIATSN